MKISTFTFFILFISFSIAGYSQDRSAGTPVQGGGYGGLISSNYQKIDLFKKSRVGYDELVSEYTFINGHPYLYKDPITVNIVNQEDLILENVNIIIDLYANEVLAWKGTDERIFLDPKQYKSMIYTNEDGEEETYIWGYGFGRTDEVFELLYKHDKFLFIKKTKIRIERNDRSVPGLESSSKNFKRTSEYYIVPTRQPQPFRVNLKKQNIFEYIPPRQSSLLKKEMRAQRIKKLKKEKQYLDLMKSMEDKW